MSINQVFRIKAKQELSQLWVLIKNQLCYGRINWLLDRADADYEVKVSITKIKNR